MHGVEIESSKRFVCLRSGPAQSEGGGKISHFRRCAINNKLTTNDVQVRTTGVVVNVSRAETADDNKWGSVYPPEQHKYAAEEFNDLLFRKKKQHGQLKAIK